MDLMKIKEDLQICMDELIEKAKFEEGDIFVLGCSTSEVKGKHIGKDTDIEVGKLIVETIKEKLDKINVNFAVQCCEHLNRALVVEKCVARKNNFEIVNVVPQKNAGGGVATSAYELFKNPVVVEKIVAKAGLDIGDTFIGMHVKFVQVPVRLSIKEIGNAHLTALTSRPKLIGGSRAVYQ
ncbi:TIGR01440 family protein [uncultured Parvimonas sp.]|uniref:TIGR01440 family protein n=1 Tax=uncultured Parvimonas sp. TaxID=747372 RepID=UPI00280402D0|nr:TIGR01440 family protein [uncultured Parvimonas sp.]